MKGQEGRALTGGDIASTSQHVVVGVDRVHTSEYSRRDLKPGTLATTTRFFEYTSVSPLALLNASKERDVVWALGTVRW